MRPSFILLAFFLFAVNASLAHSGKARYHIIIDTDGGLDDMRAISLLLASKEVEVLAIHCSDGVMLPARTSINVRSLLKAYHHEGIPVTEGVPFIDQLPQIRENLDGIAWAYASGLPEVSLASIKDIILGEEEKVTFVCLGSLHMMAGLGRSMADLSMHTEMVVWFNEDPLVSAGMNHRFSPEALGFLQENGIDTRIIACTPQVNNALLNDIFWEDVKTIPSRYAHQLAALHLSEKVKEDFETGRVNIWDELAALYLISPELFTEIGDPALPSTRVFVPDDISRIRGMYLSVLREKEPDYKVFSALPLDPAYYAEDVAPVLQQIVNDRGHHELRAGVLTNELHGHLGIYSLIGMKMGIRAREYFNIGLDDLFISSFAGTRPPVSCMNDGLQASTGGTLGHGLITSVPTETPQPTAIFSFKDRQVEISLKREVSDRIGKEVRYGVERYGLESEEYWAYIRKLAITYWAELDRNMIFDIKPIE